MSDKVAHLKLATQTRFHRCHWPGCAEQAPPAAWGCRAHWHKLPIALRNALWRAYRVGQEDDGKPSAEYVRAARAIQAWIAENHDDPPPLPPAA